MIHGRSIRSSLLRLGCLAMLFCSLLMWPPGRAEAAGFSLRFHGNGVNGIDRVKIPINNPARPADGAREGDSAVMAGGRGQRTQMRVTGMSTPVEEVTR